MPLRFVSTLSLAGLVAAGAACGRSGDGKPSDAGTAGATAGESGGIGPGGSSGAGGLAGASGGRGGGLGNAAGGAGAGGGGAAGAAAGSASGGTSGVAGATGGAGTGATAGRIGTGGASSGGRGGSAGAGFGGTTGAGGSPAIPPALTWVREGSTTYILESIWGSGPNDIYAGGRTGRLVHSTGDGKWTIQPTNAAGTLTGIWGSGPTDIYASVNANVVLHSIGDGVWDHQMTMAGWTFENVWGSGPNDIYVVGPGALHSTGNGAWQTPRQAIADGVTFAIWGSSAANIYAVNSTDTSGPSYTIFRSTGNGTWVREATPDGAYMKSIWGADANHVYAGGSQVLFSAGDGVWTPQTLPTYEPAKGYITAIGGAGPNAVYACSELGYLYRSNGAGQWSAPDQVTGSGLCYAIWVAAPNSVYIVDTFGVLHGTS